MLAKQHVDKDRQKLAFAMSPHYYMLLLFSILKRESQKPIITTSMRALIGLTANLYIA